MRNSIKRCGIYYIRSRTDNAVYIGSSVDLVRRFATHKWELRNRKHSNQHLQNAWLLHGEENFVFEVIESCSREEMFIREQYHLDHAYKIPGAKIYNLTPVAYKPAMTDEAKSRLRERMKGNTYTLGRERTPEERLATKIGNTGKVRTEAHKANYKRAAQKREDEKRAAACAIPVVAPWLDSSK